MKTSLLIRTALLALVVTGTAAFAVPASKSTPYQRGSQAPRVVVTSKTPEVRPTRMAVKNPALKITSSVACTPERMQNDAACRAHCAK